MWKELELLHEDIIEKNGAFEKVRRWYKGWHPEIPSAVLINGLTGKETRVETTIIRPIKTFIVYESKKPIVPESPWEKEYHETWAEFGEDKTPTNEDSVLWLKKLEERQQKM